jgi:hypothetical protein
MVIRRRNEIRVRMALDATPSKILTVDLRETVLPMSIGLAAGTLVAVLETMSLRRLLFRLRPNDPMTLFRAIAC